MPFAARSLRLGLWCLPGILLAACLTPPTFAARFGVPSGSADPPGYFILTGPDVPIFLDNLSWGDNLHAQEFFIEVTGNTLRVDVYDPGLVNSNLSGLDAYFSGDVGTTTYELYDGSMTLLANQTIGPDSAAPDGTDRALDTLFNGPTVPGMHRLLVYMDDNFTWDEDFNTFGLSVPGYDVFAFWFTGGELNFAAATISEPLVLYPWIIRSTPTTMTGTETTGVDVSTFDLDAWFSTAPPYVTFESPSGRSVELTPSDDNQLFVTNLAGLDVDDLDCSDYGLWELSFSSLSSAFEGENDLNIFTSQIYEFEAGVVPDEYPLLAGDLRQPVRMYLPRDDGSAPHKESLVHFGRIVSGPDPPSVATPSVVEVTMEVRNPTAYELSSVELHSHINGNPQFSAPVVVSTEGGLLASPMGKDVTVLGNVAAGVTGRVVYQTTVTPTFTGYQYVTGDGSDMQGGSLPTQGTYQTPFWDEEGFGPICMLRIDAVSAAPECTAVAAIGGTTAACAGDEVSLSAAGTTMSGCTGSTEYRWLRDGAEIMPFPGSVDLLDTPSATATYSVEVRCSTLTTCFDAAGQLVSIEDDTPPTPVGDTLRAIKDMDGVRFYWAPNGATEYNLRRHTIKLFDRPTSMLVETLSAGTAFIPLEVPRPPRDVYYKVFAVNCAGTEEDGTGGKRADVTAPRVEQETVVLPRR